MSKKEKPLFTNLISGNQTAPDVNETIQKTLSENKTTEESPITSAVEKEPARDTDNAERQSPGRHRTTDKQEGVEGKLYIKGIPVKPVIVHLPQEVAEKTKAIAVMEGTTMREVITQAMSLCIQRYEKKHGGIRPLQQKTERIFE